jgi:hypothetical protein
MSSVRLLNFSDAFLKIFMYFLQDMRNKINLMFWSMFPGFLLVCGFDRFLPPFALASHWLEDLHLIQKLKGQMTIDQCSTTFLSETPAASQSTFLIVQIINFTSLVVF